MAITVLPKYLVKTLAPYVLMALGIFSAILFMNQFVRIFNTAIIIGASLDWVFYSIFQLMPMVLSLSLPMAFQLGLLLTLSGLSEQGEILALRAAGFSFRQVVWPLGLAAALLCLVMLWVGNWASPQGMRRFQDSRHFLAESITKLRIEPRTFVDIGEWKFYADGVEPASGKVYKVHLFRMQNADKTSAALRISAPRGRYSVGPHKGFALELFDGELQRLDPADPLKVVIAKFSSYSVFIPFGMKTTKRKDFLLAEMTTPQILAVLKASNIKNRELIEPETRQYIPDYFSERELVQRFVEARVEIATRLAMALSPLVFFWISCPLGLTMARRSKIWGMLSSIIILFAYYLLMAFGLSMGKREPSLAWFAPWTADLAGLAAGFALWRQRLSRH